MLASAIFREPFFPAGSARGAIWPYSETARKPAHFHGQLEFLLVLRGCFRERLGTRLHTVHAGQLLWHLPLIEHEFVAASPDLDLRVVHFEPELGLAAPRLSPPTESAAELRDARRFERWLSGLGRLASGRPVVELKERDRDRLLEECDRTSLEPAAAASIGTRLQKALGAATAATLSDHDDRKPNSIVELACCLLLDDPSSSRRAVCRALDVSEGFLSRRFQAELGLTFQEQRARIRISHFIAHASSQQHNWLEAALSSGFGSYAQLYRVFARLTGMSPRAYFSRGGRDQRDRIGCRTPLPELTR